MTWKSIPVAGAATIAATWLASYSPVGQPRSAAATAPSAARTEIAAAEIQREADRLHSRLGQIAGFRDPTRNPFVFGVQRRVGVQTSRREPTLTVEDLPSEPIDAPPTLRVALSGVAEDVVGDETIRTAIISTQEDVFLMKVGDTFLGQYKVTKVDADAVDLVRLDTGAVVRLTLRP